MNQILFLQDSNYNLSKKSSKQKRHFFTLILLICIIIILSLLVYMYNYLLSLKLQEYSAKNLSNSFSIQSLYNGNANYSTSLSYDYSTNKDLFVIGMIEIDKIRLHYPILSYSTLDTLKIAPCRFAGPMPNEVGTLCIAGHNYIDNSFFAKIKLLDINDIVKIYDIYGNFKNYIIFNKKDIANNDTSITSQETNGDKIVTLMTCNSLTDTRFVLVAKEVR